MRSRSARCVQAIVVVSVALGASACATEPPRTPAELAADAELATRVEQALLGDPRIFARHIDVDADRGVVLLSGYVWSADDFYEAKRIAATVPGATAVVDRMELMVGGRTGAR